MAPKLSWFLSSDVLEVVAGLDSKRFRIHGELLASQSGALWWEVNNRLCSHEGRQIVIQEHDGATIGRLAEFLYTGDYEAPEPVKTSDISKNGAIRSSLSPRPETVSTKEITTQKRETKITYPAEVNANSTRPGLGICDPSDHRPLDAPPVYDALESPASELPATDPPGALQSPLTPEFDFRDVFLAHGKICALAHSFDIEPLEKLAITRLEVIFSMIPSPTHETQVVSNFAELVGYAYQNSTSEKLRQALLIFLSPNVSVLNGLELQQLVSCCGDLASNLIEILCAKLKVPEQENGQLLLEIETLKTKLKFLAEKNQGHAEIHAKLEEALRGALKAVEEERTQKEDWVASLDDYKSMVEALGEQKDRLVIENGAIKKDLERAKQKNSEYRLRMEGMA